jgi:hypothetical protein
MYRENLFISFFVEELMLFSITEILKKGIVLLCLWQNKFHQHSQKIAKQFLVIPFHL